MSDEAICIGGPKALTSTPNKVSKLPKTVFRWVKCSFTSLSLFLWLCSSIFIGLCSPDHSELLSNVRLCCFTYTSLFLFHFPFLLATCRHLLLLFFISFTLRLLSFLFHFSMSNLFSSFCLHIFSSVTISLKSASLSSVFKINLLFSLSLFSPFFFSFLPLSFLASLI